MYKNASKREICIRKKSCMGLHVIGCYGFFVLSPMVLYICKQQNIILQQRRSTIRQDTTFDWFFVFAISCIAFLKWSDSSNYAAEQTDVSNFLLLTSKLRCKCTRRHVLRFWGIMGHSAKISWERYTKCVMQRHGVYGMAWFKSNFNYICCGCIN